MEQKESFQHFLARFNLLLILFFILIIGLFSGCNRGAPELQATPSIIETPAPAVLPSVTFTPTRSFTPTNSPTPAPSVTPGIFDQVPVPPNAGNFLVITPEAELLWDLVRMAGKVNERDGDDEIHGKISDTERSAIYRLIQHDLQSYYPNGLPGTIELIENRNFLADGYDPLISSLIPVNLIAIINRDRLKFVPEESMTVVDFNVTPYLLELDGEAHNEWIIMVTNNRLSYSDWIYVKEQEDSVYTLLPSDPLTMPFGSQNTQVMFDQDLTGDGRNEIVFSTFDYAWGSKFGFVQVFTWDGSRIARILDLEKYIRSTDFSLLEELTIDFTIGDVNGDGSDEIQIKLPRSANFGCTWDEAGSYRWNGMAPNFQVKGATPPETPVCWAAQGLSPTNEIPVEQKVNFLEKALNNLASPDLIALVRVHLGVGYTILGKDIEAQQTLSGIERLSSNNSLVKVIQDTYKAANGSVLELCDGLFRSAQNGALPVENETVQNLSYSSSLGAYGFDSSPYPPMLCPLPDLIKSQLENVNLPASSSPIALLKTMGFPIEATAELQLDEDKTKEIAAVVGEGEPQVIVLDLNQDVWKVYRAARFSAPVDNIQFAAYDIYQDNRIELLVSAVLQEPVPHSAYSSCWGPNVGKTTQYIVIEKEHSHFGAIWGDELCGEKQDLKEFVESGRFEFALMQGGTLSSDQSLAEIFRRKYAFSLQELSKLEERDIWHGMDLLLDEILYGHGKIASDQKTGTMLRWISPAAPGGERIIQRMLYFTGIYFELNGQSERAGQVYKQLVSKWPDSIWSWMAWARIKVSSVSG